MRITCLALRALLLGWDSNRGHPVWRSVVLPTRPWPVFCKEKLPLCTCMYTTLHILCVKYECMQELGKRKLINVIYESQRSQYSQFIYISFKCVTCLICIFAWIVKLLIFFCTNTYQFLHAFLLPELGPQVAEIQQKANSPRVNRNKVYIL